MHASLRREVQSNLLLGGPGRLVLAAEADNAGGQNGRDLVQALGGGDRDEGQGVHPSGRPAQVIDVLNLLRVSSMINRVLL